MRFSRNKFNHYLWLYKYIFFWLYKKLQLGQYLSHRNKTWHNDSLYNELQKGVKELGNLI